MLTSFYIFFFLFNLLQIHYSNSIFFKKSRFYPSDESIIYEGGAYSYVGVIELNSDSYMCQVGRATYAQKVPLWDSQTPTVSDFSTHFTFFIDVLSSPSYGSGLTFFIAPYQFPIPTNSACGFLGLYNLTTRNYSLHNQIVHVEFDSFPDSGWDPPIEHVGINVNSLSSRTYTKWNASFHTGDTADVWITYDSTAKNLTVSWKYRTTFSSQENSTISTIIDLTEVLPEWVSVGFSASSRDFIERNVIQSWEFNSSLEIDESSKISSTKEKLAVWISASVSVLIVVAGVGAFGIFWRNKINRDKSESRTASASINDDLERGAFPRRFSCTELSSATNNFSNGRKLGEGGFGTVYKGYLRNLKSEIAVKKISRGSKQGKKEYITEVKIIGRLRHRNLVQLIGWCHERGDFLLVYEYMPNGSLYSHLFGDKSPLTWPERYRIGIGLCWALHYLHEEWEQCVVHRDIKSSNVMLDLNFNVKLGDFGLARLADHELGPQTTGLAGTLGYLAPEYVTTGRASKESDSYSFGIVALEIATGRKAVDPIEPKFDMSLVEWVWDLYRNGKLKSGIDKRLNGDFDVKEVECLMIVGLWCAHPDRCLRPSIRQAIHVLDFEAGVPNLPTKMPVPMYSKLSPKRDDPLIYSLNTKMDSSSSITL